MGNSQRIVVILGPTAGGKSELAVAVARQFGGEIINADSMQVYRGLDAGTAKPTTGQRNAVPHHLVDCVDPTEPWTVADWLDAAEQLIGDMQRRGVLAVIVGGTNLYLKALLEGMFEGPPADRAFRDSLRETDAPALHERLAEIDPPAAETIKPMDRKRIVRALEVYHATGQRISALQQQWDEQTKAYKHDPILIGLRWSVEAINRRINARVKAMFDSAACRLAGHEDLLCETRRLHEAGQLGPQTREAIGTKQVLEHLAGLCTLEEAVERVKIDTRRFAKQQRTWLKRYRGVHWLDGDQLDDAQRAQAAIEIVQNEM